MCSGGRARSAELGGRNVEAMRSCLVQLGAEESHACDRERHTPYSRLTTALWKSVVSFRGPIEIPIGF